MNLLVIVLVVIVVLALLVALKTKQPSSDKGLAFESRDTLFTPAERSFLGVLEQSIDDRYRVFGKVRLGDIVKPAKGLSNSKRTTALNKINQKHVDFVICSAADLSVIGVVELDDQSHGREDRAGRDEFVDQALAGAKVPVVRFSAKKGYQIQEVRAKLTESLNVGNVTTTSPTIQETVSPSPPVPATVADPPKTQPEEEPPACPKCSTIMVKRQAKNGPHAGKYFWACSSYPKCRQVVAID